MVPKICVSCKLTLYEDHKKSMRARGKRAVKKLKKSTVHNEKEQKAMRNHLTACCPTKNKDTKCFKCQEYGVLDQINYRYM